MHLPRIRHDLRLKSHPNIRKMSPALPSPILLSTPPLNNYQDIILQIHEAGIACITLNRPTSLNAFGGVLLDELQDALLYVAEQRPDVCVTVLTGAGRFFSSGADVRGGDSFDWDAEPKSRIARKKKYTERYAVYADVLRTLINHPKALILALNGPCVGGGAAWFLGVADLIFASSTAYAQVPFSALGLVPEQGELGD